MKKEFVITAEITPPHGTDTSDAIQKASLLSPYISAFNVTDNQNSRLKLSSLALSSLMVERGYDVIYQLTCRDRNRLALQSDLLGAWSLGIRNVLALTGDHISSGDHPESAVVFDLDSIQLLSVIKSLNSGIDMVDKALSGSPRFFAGAAIACESDPLALQLLRFEKKIRAGAAFFQTQVLFNPSSLAPFLEIANRHGVYLMAGVLLIHSLKMIDFINDKVPGLKIPDEMSNRIRRSSDFLETGLEEAVRLIQECRPYCHGVHLMTAGHEDSIPKILKRAGLA